MVEARKDHDKMPVADNAPSDLSRFAEASSKLFAEQAAAMAVMTAYGMTMAAQMTGMMLGALRGPASPDASEEPAEPKFSPIDRNPAAKVVPLRLQAPKAAEDKSVGAAAAAEKPAGKAARLVKAKAAPAKARTSEPSPRVAAKTASSPTAAADRDDLKRISGIGPRLEQELNARGIVRFGDIAALGKAAVKKLDTELGLDGRILRDDWIGQAKALSGGKG